MGDAKRRQALGTTAIAEPNGEKYQAAKQELLKEITGSDSLLALAEAAIARQEVLTCLPVDGLACWTVEPKMGSDRITWGVSAKRFFQMAVNHDRLLVACFLKGAGCLLFGYEPKSLTQEVL